MPECDHYRLLRVSRFASPESVREAYIKLIKAHHDGTAPPFSDDMLRRLHRAYWELRHADRRLAYDARLLGDVQRTRAERRRRRAARRGAKAATPPRPRTGLRVSPLVFAAALVLVAGGIGWAVRTRDLPASPVPVAEVSAPSELAASLRRTWIAEAMTDYDLLTASRGRRAVITQVAQCFAEMAVVASEPVFDYCVSLDSLAARDAAAEPFFADDARRARLASVAPLGGAGATARLEAIERYLRDASVKAASAPRPPPRPALAYDAPPAR